jgi:hypothetical protein
MLLWHNGRVVSETEKAGKTRQVWVGKANVSESLRTCRNRKDVIESRLDTLACDEARGMPADCPSGDRHKGGAILTQALVRNVGTYRLDEARGAGLRAASKGAEAPPDPKVKGELQVADP